jgi:hypothetical protein
VEWAALALKHVAGGVADMRGRYAKSLMTPKSYPERNPIESVLPAAKTKPSGEQGAPKKQKQARTTVDLTKE